MRDNHVYCLFFCSESGSWPVAGSPCDCSQMNISFCLTFIFRGAEQPSYMQHSATSSPQHWPVNTDLFGRLLGWKSGRGEENWTKMLRIMQCCEEARMTSDQSDDGWRRKSAGAVCRQYRKKMPTDKLVSTQRLSPRDVSRHTQKILNWK